MYSHCVTKLHWTSLNKITKSQFTVRDYLLLCRDSSSSEITNYLSQHNQNMNVYATKLFKYHKWNCHTVSITCLDACHPTAIGCTLKHNLRSLLLYEVRTIQMRLHDCQGSARKESKRTFPLCDIRACRPRVLSTISKKE